MELNAHTSRPRPRLGAESRTPAAALGRLLGRIASGSEAALADLYDAMSAWVHGLALRILGDAAAAEEVTLDVFHQAWHQAHRFDPVRGTAHAWLLAIARNRAIDRLRCRRHSERREQPLGEEAHRTMDPRPEPDIACALADRGARVRHALDELSAEQRQVIELAFFDGLSHGQIAVRLGQPLGTVKTRIRAGIRKLQSTLREARDECQDRDDRDDGNPGTRRQEKRR